MNKKEKTTKENLLFKGRILSMYNNDVVTLDGNKTTREIVTHPGGACVLAYIDKKILFIKQYRYPFDEEIIELPAGKIENNENPIDTAVRELEEETGYKPLSIKPMGVIYPSVGYTNEKIFLFYADKFNITKTNFDKDEFIESFFLTPEEAINYINEGKIKDAKTVVLIYKFLQEKH